MNTSRDIHVIPLDDYRKHESRKDCWCKPTQDSDEPLLFTHHSMDGREDYENGRKPQ